MANTKSKNAILEETYARIRKKGYVPIINKEFSSSCEIQVDEVCVHGRSDTSRYVTFWGDTDEDIDLEPPPEDRGWKCDSAGFGGGQRCEVCRIGIRVVCPKCDNPFPRPTEEQTIKAYEHEEDVLCTSTCSKCQSPWLVWLGGGQAPSHTPKTIDAIACGQWGLKQRIRKPERNVFSDQKADRIPPKARPMRNGRPIGRNSECPCGSGKKYKRCCETASPNNQKMNSKRWGASGPGGIDTEAEMCEMDNATNEAAGRAFERCPKDNCPADVDYESLDIQGTPDGIGGSIHRCDMDELMKEYPGRFREAK